jgi:hypothetical protein
VSLDLIRNDVNQQEQQEPGDHSPDEWLLKGLAAIRAGAVFALPLEDAQHDLALSLTIDPARLTRQIANTVSANGVSWSPVDYFLAGGDWTDWTTEIEGTRVFREARQLKNRKYRFRQTKSYRHRLGLLERGTPFTLNHVQIDSVQKLDDYFSNFEKMFQSAGEHGIVPRQSSGAVWQRADDAVNSARPLWAEYAESEVGIAISQDGSLLRVGPGQHRTAVAKLLELQSLPVEVRLIHADWLSSLMEKTQRGPLEALRIGLQQIRATARDPAISTEPRDEP